MALTLTESAAEWVRERLRERGHGLGLRVGVRRSGCSGYAYELDYADEIRAEDVVFDEHGVKLVVDEVSLDVIDGTEVDFVREGLNESFRFHNPKVAEECGCGESFSVRADR